MNQLAKKLKGKELFNACLLAHLPVGRIRTLDQVFTDKEAQALILEEQNGEDLTKRISGNVFHITPNP